MVFCREQRFTWFDGLPADEASPAAEIERRQKEIAASLVPEDAIRLRGLITQAAAGGKESLSTTVRHRDGRGNVTHLRMSLRILRDAGGKPLRSVGSTLDVTEPSFDMAELEDAVTKIGTELARVSAALRQHSAHVTGAVQPAS